MSPEEKKTCARILIADINEKIETLQKSMEPEQLTQVYTKLIGPYLAMNMPLEPWFASREVFEEGQIENITGKRIPALVTAKLKLEDFIALN